MLAEAGAEVAWEKQGQPLSPRLPRLLHKRMEQDLTSYNSLSCYDRRSLPARLFAVSPMIEK